MKNDNHMSDAASAEALVGHTVEKALDATFWRLVSGELTLAQLTPALRAFYNAGFEDGQQSMREPLERAENEADRLYRQAFPTPPAEWSRRLGNALESALQEEVTR